MSVSNFISIEDKFLLVCFLDYDCDAQGAQDYSLSQEKIRLAGYLKILIPLLI